MKFNQAQLLTMHAAMKHIEDFAKHNQQLIVSELNNQPAPEGEVPNFRFNLIRSNILDIMKEITTFIAITMYNVPSK